MGANKVYAFPLFFLFAVGVGELPHSLMWCGEPLLSLFSLFSPLFLLGGSHPVTAIARGPGYTPFSFLVGTDPTGHPWTATVGAQASSSSPLPPTLATVEEATPSPSLFFQGFAMVVPHLFESASDAVYVFSSFFSPSQ